MKSNIIKTINIKFTKNIKMSKINNKIIKNIMTNIQKIISHKEEMIINNYI